MPRFARLKRTLSRFGMLVMYRRIASPKFTLKSLLVLFTLIAIGIALVSNNYHRRDLTTQIVDRASWDSATQNEKCLLLIGGDTVTLSERSRVILTYALCGFSNFGAIGIQIGGIGPLAPSRRSDLAQLGLRAMFGGMLAACMTACMAGIMYGVLR